jgi:hypothetical protein
MEPAYACLKLIMVQLTACNGQLTQQQSTPAPQQKRSELAQLTWQYANDIINQPPCCIYPKRIAEPPVC